MKIGIIMLLTLFSLGRTNEMSFGSYMKQLERFNVSSAALKYQFNLAPAIKKDAIVKIAEIILIELYGKEVLSQRPWILTEYKDAYMIEGTFHEKNTDKKGGVAKIALSKKDLRVIGYIHQK